MKKIALVTLVMALLIGMASTWCLAQSVANTSKKGSLLIFPLTRVTYHPPSDPRGWDTMITISNDYPAGLIVRCYIIPQSCDPTNDWMDLEITASQPFVFWLSDIFGLDGKYELKCWAYKTVDDNGSYSEDTAIMWNHLAGEATMVHYDGNGVIDGAFTTNAWRFAAIKGSDPKGPQKNGDPIGDPADVDVGKLELTGTTLPFGSYDACPEKLLFDIRKQVPDHEAPAYGDLGQDNYIALVPCKQDLTQETGGPTTNKAKLRVCNANEECRGAEFCVNCFFANSLDKAVPLAQALGTDGGYIEVTSPKDTSPTAPCGVTDGAPFVGASAITFVGDNGPVAGTTPTAVGAAAGLIKYDK